MAAALNIKRLQSSSRPFYTAIFCITLIAVYSIFVRGTTSTYRDAAVLGMRSSEDCLLVHHAPDKCAFVQLNCHDEEAGLVKYLTFYYCTLGEVQPIAFVILMSWLGLLFTTIGIAASDFFCVNLSTIATILGLSESLAGVTFLAFGNGSPDVFSTFAAMSSNSGSMAVGELIGAAGFITAVIAGSMALVREFKVSTKTFVRDICFFIGAVSFAMYFLADGRIHLWECCLMIGFYIFYVIVVVGWHAFVNRRKARREREAASRGHFNIAGVHGENDELEAYRDDPEDHDPTTGRRSAPFADDIGALERGPRIEIGEATNVEDDEASGQQVAAEMTSSMRVMRPRGRRNTTTITPIRPSLVGALEFRSVLSSLQDEGNVRLTHIRHSRSHSADRLVNGTLWEPNAPNPNRPTVRRNGSVQTIMGPELSLRNRSQSLGRLTPVLDDIAASPTSIASEDRRETSSPSAHTVAGKLAPPPIDSNSGRAADADSLLSPSQLRISVPNQAGSEASSPALSPLSRYTDTPEPFPTNASQSSHVLHIAPSEVSGPLILEGQKPVRWWPYRLLPAPHVLTGTLFPTLQDWRGKTVWDKLVSIISVPSIFLLAITLPVVEGEVRDDDSDSSIVERPASGHLSNTTVPISINSSGLFEPETEWERYRRSRRSQDSSGHTSPVLIPLDAPDETRGSMPTEPVSRILPTLDTQIVKPMPELASTNSTLQDQGWNRWLLIVQLFTGPLFCVFIVWANMAEDQHHPIKVFIRAVLISLLCSLVALAVLLVTTTPDRRPKYHFLFCFMGFVIAIAWISTIAAEVVGVLKAFGVILDISEAILGLTVFAVGNSVGDLVANVTIARLGYPVMALSACFGGPLLNIMLGIGLGGAYQTIQAANKHHKKHPGRPIEYDAYQIQVGATLLVSAVVLLVTLLSLLVFVPLNDWMMNRKIGIGLITLWAIGTVINLVIEMTGIWRDIA